MTVLTETTHDGEFLVAELPGLLSRKAATLTAGKLAAGTVLGAALAAGSAVAGTNTGNGAVTVGSIGPDAQVGTYTLKCVAAAANAGTFNLIAPDGTEVREITVGGGLSANDHVAITIADGATDFVVGDSFTVAVSLSGYKQLDPAATDGSQTAAAILYAAADASSASVACVVVNKTAAVVSAALVWPAGITSPQKTTALADLAGRGIDVR